MHRPERVQRVSDTTIKNVFISHIHEGDAGLGKTKDLLEKNAMTLQDGSISTEKPDEAKSPEYIKSEILAPRIRGDGIFITYIKPQTKDSEWDDWEIE